MYIQVGEGLEYNKKAKDRVEGHLTEEIEKEDHEELEAKI